MSEKVDEMLALLAVTAGGKGRVWIDELESWPIHTHLQFAGHGTASSEMMELLGLETAQKDLVLSLASRTAAEAFCHHLSGTLLHRQRVNGILMLVKLSAVNHLIAIMATDQAEQFFQKGDKKMSEPDSSMQNTEKSHDYGLIIVAVNRGYTEEVMKTARQAGASGGTIIRSRLANAEQAEDFYGMQLDSEKELLVMLVSSSSRNAILDAINSEYGLRSPAQSVIMAIPVEKAFKI